MLDFTWKYQRITDINNEWVYVYACPITKIIEVSEILSYLSVIFKKVNLTVQQLLDAENEYKLGIRTLIVKVLKAHNLNIELLDSHSLQELFIDPGYLFTLNGFSLNPEPNQKQNQDSGEQGLSLFEFESKMVTRLIDAKLARNLTQAIAIADSIPHDKLRAYINARITQLDPEFEKKEKEKEDSKRMMKDFADDFKTGKFFESQKGNILLNNLNENFIL